MSSVVAMVMKSKKDRRVDVCASPCEVFAGWLVVVGIGMVSFSSTGAAVLSMLAVIGRFG